MSKNMPPQHGLMSASNLPKGKSIFPLPITAKGFKLAGDVGDLPRDGRLGLMGMKERVNLLGGELAITSEPSQGTHVLIQLPT